MSIYIDILETMSLYQSLQFQSILTGFFLPCVFACPFFLSENPHSNTSGMVWDSSAIRNSLLNINL